MNLSGSYNQVQDSLNNNIRPNSNFFTFLHAHQTSNV